MLVLGTNTWAQTLAASLSSSGTQSLAAGASFTNGGTLSVSASGITSGNIQITGITLTISNPGDFSSLILNSSSPNGSESDQVSLQTGNNTISLSQISLANGQSATFTLSGTVSSTPASSGMVRNQSKRFQLASMFAPGPASGVSLLLLGLAVLVMRAAAGRKLRRWHLIAFALWAVMSAVVVGCGNGGSSSSDQQVVSLSATASSGSAITVTGSLPIDLGTISVSGSSSSQTIQPSSSAT